MLQDMEQFSVIIKEARYCCSLERMTTKPSNKLNYVAKHTHTAFLLRLFSMASNSLLTVVRTKHKMFT